MSDASFSIFKDVNNLSIGSANITTAPNNSRITLNVNPYTNHGQHAQGGRIDNYSEQRRAVSARDIDSPSMVPDLRPPAHERVKSAPAVIKSQPSSLPPLRENSQDGPPPDVKANVNTTSDIFPELWTGALEKYKEKTGVDIQDRRNEFVQLFEDCEGTGDALTVLGDLPVFSKPGARASWVRIKGSLKKILDVAIMLNTLAAEVGNVAVPRFGKLIFVGTGLLLKAAKDITKETEALEKLFSRLAAFLSRLEVRGRSKIQPSSKRIFIRILVELLNALAIATVIAKGTLWGKFKRSTKKLLFEEDEIEKVMSKLSELTQEESAMVLAELAASRDDFEELIKEMGGLKGLAKQIRSVIGIGNLESKELNQLSSLLRSRDTEDRPEILGILQLLKIENDGTQNALSRIEAEVQELRKSLVRDAGQSTANGQTSHETSGVDDRPASGGMQDNYEDYSNYGQHIAGGKVEIRNPETTAPPLNLESRRPERPSPSAVPTGTSRDRYGAYHNYGQHVTNGEVIITGAKTNVQRNS